MKNGQAVLVPLLTGKALEAEVTMDEERSDDYTDLKEVLLINFNISPETYHQQLGSSSTPPSWRFQQRRTFA